MEVLAAGGGGLLTTFSSGMFPRDACLSIAFDLDDDRRDGLHLLILIRTSATRRSTIVESRAI